MTIWIVLALIGLDTPASTDRDGTSVGMPAKIAGLLLPGTELEPKPLDDRTSPIVIRVTETYKHGDSFRYDLTYYGLEPGDYDLAPYLRRKDGSSTANLPKIPVTIRAILPPGQVEPHQLKPAETPSLGGYRLWMALGAAAWVAGLVGILFLGRKKRRVLVAGPHAMTLADRLRPLVEAARKGTLSEGQHAELERMLIGYWRTKLDLNEAEPGEAIAAMKRDEKAGPLIRQLEAWLHRPAGEADSVDVARLLEPYRDLPAEEPAIA